MGKQLMYGESSQPGWYDYHQMTEDNIDREITDSVNTKKNMSLIPKVSVPSPFARFELVQKAFANVAAKGENGADMRDRILVSEALDVAQLFYESGSRPDGEIEIVEWKKYYAIDQLRKSQDRGKVLYGNALELYMRQENYGFNEKLYHTDSGVPFDSLSIYILTYNGDPIGCTSPTSLFMATPRVSDFQQVLKIDGDKFLFLDRRSLLQRDHAFIEYLYKTVSRIKYDSGNTQSPLKGFKDYLVAQRELMDKSSELYYKTNPDQWVGVSESDLMEDYEGTEQYVLGQRLYRRRREDVHKFIPESSDFVIEPTKSPRETLPLVLSNNCPYKNLKYYASNVLWNLSKHRIDYSIRAQKTLPGTNIEYPWLCEDDFLDDVLIQLPYDLDRDHFLDDGEPHNGHSYLPPLKSAFFEYFDKDLIGKKNGRDPYYRIEEREKDGKLIEAVVTLQIPIRGGQTIPLKKTYKVGSNKAEDLRSISGRSEEAYGSLVVASLSLSIFPFTKLQEHNNYSIQLVHMDVSDEFEVMAKAFKQREEGIDMEVEWSADDVRSNYTRYYTLKDAFDYLQIQLRDKGYKNRIIEAVLIPQWGKTKSGTGTLKFAFDFGTSNSHIAVMEVDSHQNTQLDFKLGNSLVSTISPRQTEMTRKVNLLQKITKQEFVPPVIGGEYAFPFRTVISAPKEIDFTSKKPTALQRVNIPFVYGKEDHNRDNSIKSNLKWSNNTSERKFAGSYIEEMALLARAYAIEHGAKLSDCSFTWTYPLSMRKSAIDDFNAQWIHYYHDYFDPSKEEEDLSDRVTKMSESIAPLLYYYDNDRALIQMSLSIDIGGGTTDTVIMRNEKDIKIISFRFGADAIFGAGKVSSNPMVNHYYDRFVKILKDIGGVTDEACKLLTKFHDAPETSVSEFNSVLFALETNPALSKMSSEDRSYNEKLRQDHKRKIIFLYYYAAMVYYLTRLVLETSDNAGEAYPKPEKFLFSGTGSKLLSIIGQKETLEYITTLLISAFSDNKFQYKNGDICIEIEGKEPKQVTAKGALFKKDLAKEIAEQFTESRMVDKKTVNYSMIKDKDGSPLTLTYADLAKSDYRQIIVDEVESFNRKFIELIYKEELVEELGLDEGSVHTLKMLMNKDLRAFLDTEISEVAKFDNNDDKPYEDALFFYSVKGVIQRLIEEIK